MSVLGPLLSKRFRDYTVVDKRIPDERDMVVTGIIDAYRAGTPTARTEIRDELGPRTAASLNCYGQRMASLARRSQSPEPLERAVIAVGLAVPLLEDYRNSLFVLAAINHAAEALGTDLSHLIEPFAPIIPDRGMAALRAFAGREENDKSLRAFGIRILGDGADFRYH
ncbi:hypothetical protein [Nocardia alni]|uniref:hypothetical protein n=1 Tax=Nocardia alni TaxID=2815723 RepID=UPI001C225148|nr:hypothetical protein [Nocardia alni]